MYCVNDIWTVVEEVPRFWREHSMEKQLALYPEKCVGCRNCSMLCSMRHFGTYELSLSAVTVFRFFDDGVHVPLMCLQCDQPQCVKVCSTGALNRLESGMVTLSANRCIGCKYCVQACPTGAIFHTPEYEKVLKCDLCDGATLCATWCPMQAIVYSEAPTGAARQKAIAEGLRASVVAEREERLATTAPSSL